MQLAVFGAQLHLARGRAGAARALHQVLDFRRILARKQVLQARGASTFGRQNLGERLVDALDIAIRPDGDDAGGDAFENGFGEAAAAVQLTAGGFQLLGHLVEAAHQQRQLVDRPHLYAVLQVALAHLAGGQNRGDGTLICLARNSAIQVATKSTNSVIRAISMR